MRSWKINRSTVSAAAADVELLLRAYVAENGQNFWRFARAGTVAASLGIEVTAESLAANRAASHDRVMEIIPGDLTLSMTALENAWQLRVENRLSPNQGSPVI